MLSALDPDAVVTQAVMRLRTVSTMPILTTCATSLALTLWAMTILLSTALLPRAETVSRRQPGRPLPRVAFFTSKTVLVHVMVAVGEREALGGVRSTILASGCVVLLEPSFARLQPTRYQLTTVSLLHSQSQH